jgi:kynurenine formamidase
MRPSTDRLRRRARGAIAPALAALLAGAGGALAAGASLPGGDHAAERGVPAGYRSVDPRTARAVDLGQPLTRNAPTFPGDPRFRWRVFTTVPESGFLLEQITSLGTHTGTHISAPCHFHERARCVAALGERFFAPRPLALVDVSARVARAGGDFFVTVRDLRAWERRHGRVPRGAYVVLRTGAAAFYRLGNARRPGAFDDYFDSAPGFSGPAVDWLFTRRGVLGVGSDSFGPDATMDAAFAATTAATAHGGITIENLGAGLARMRPSGDWIALNGPRYATTPRERRAGVPGFSGTHVGVTGFTRSPSAS